MFDMRLFKTYGKWARVNIFTNIVLFTAIFTWSFIIVTFTCPTCLTDSGTESESSGFILMAIQQIVGIVLLPSVVLSFVSAFVATYHRFKYMQRMSWVSVMFSYGFLLLILFGLYSI